MRRRAFHIIGVLGCLLIAATAVSQEGHPLTGTWSGSWGPTTAEQKHVTLVMAWDGSKVTGVINPGPDSIPISVVTLDPMTWTVRIEAERKDKSGKASRIEAEGKLEDLSSIHRKLIGTWTDGTSKGALRLVRD
jgi:hypothetical protein